MAERATANSDGEAIGLSHQEAQGRLASEGPNVTPAPPARTLLQVARDQATSFIILLLLGAGLLSFALGEPGQGAAILAALVLNAAVGGAMDYRSSRDIEALQALAAPHARVRREGQEWEIPAADVVRGDVLVIQAGDRIPADARLLAGSLLLDESMLTGESFPIWRHAPAGLVHAGTLCFEGSAIALVVATGRSTEMGRIGRLLRETERPPSPLQLRLEDLGRILIWTVGALAILIVAIGLIQQRPFWPLAQTAIALAIAAIPEGLPAVATLALAFGARKLASLGLQVRRIQTVETLGTVTVLCVDKTGTLTTNQMAVERIETPGIRLTVSGPALDPKGAFLDRNQPRDPKAIGGLVGLLQAAQLCNDARYERNEAAWHLHGDPSEGALLIVAARAGLVDPRPSCTRRWSVTPGPGRPWMAVCCESDAGAIVAVKGAPEAVLPRCDAELIDDGAPVSSFRGAIVISELLQTAASPLSTSRTQSWLRRSRAMARFGLRVFAVAARRPAHQRWVDPGGGQERPLAHEECESPNAAGDGGWTFLGLVGMADPPRPESRQALADLSQVGIRLVMVTGDHPDTAKAIARQINLVGSRPLKVDAGSPSPPPDSDVLARVSPEGKYRLVGALQRSGETVAMMGDGVNDAPALRAADIGIAVRSGSDVAKQAAEAVLVTPKLDILLGAVLQGRTVFRNIQSAADYLITCSAATMIAVLVATAVGWPLPLSPLQILYLNLLVHTFPALGLSLGESDVGRRSPVTRQVMLLGPARIAAIVWHGLVVATAALAIGIWGFAHGSPAHGQTLFLVTIALALGLHAFTDRHPGAFRGLLGTEALRLARWVAPVFILVLAASNLRWLAIALGTSPLDGYDWLLASASAMTSFAAIEVSKWVLPPEQAERGPDR